MKTVAILSAVMAVASAQQSWESWAKNSTTTTPAKETTTASSTWGEWTTTEVKTTPVAESTWAQWTSAPVTPVAASSSSTWAAWTTSAAPAPAANSTVSAPISKWTGAANKGNMVGGAAVGLAAVAFML